MGRQLGFAYSITVKNLLGSFRAIIILNHLSNQLALKYSVGGCSFQHNIFDFNSFVLLHFLGVHAVLTQGLTFSFFVPL